MRIFERAQSTLQRGSEAIAASRPMQLGGIALILSAETAAFDTPGKIVTAVIETAALARYMDHNKQQQVEAMRKSLMG